MIRSRMLRLISGFALLMVGASMFGQEKAAPPGETTTFVSRSELVLVPVTVQGKDKRTIGGLTKGDFRVEADGKAQTISVFQEITASPAAQAPITSSGAQSAAGSENSYSNFADIPEQPHQLTIIVLDLVNTPILTQARAKSELIQYLSRSLQMSDPTSLLVLGRSGIRQVHSFTTNSKVLIAALRRARGEVGQADVNDNISGDLSVEEQAQVSEEASALAELQSATDTEAAFQKRDAIRRTLSALTQIAQAYAGVPGRKNILWATSGFPFTINDPREFAGRATDVIEMYEEVWRALNASMMSVSPIDVEGLVNTNFESQYGVSVGKPSNQQSARIRYDAGQERKATLRAFAESTGGTVCIERNDLSKCIAEVVEEGRAYYLLGFYVATDAQRKPGWHPLKVHVARGGTRVRSRNGFLIAQPGDAVDERLAKQQLAAAVESPLDFTGIEMSVRLKAVSPQSSNDPAKQSFALKFADGSFYIDRGKENAVDLSIVAVAVDAKGDLHSPVSKELRAHLSAESMQKVARGGLTFEDEIPVTKDTMRLRITVRDNQSGRIGTVEAPLSDR